MSPWFDTHVHLDRYAEAERATLLARAEAANVAVISVAVDIESSRALGEVAGLAGYGVGVHPRYAGLMDDSLGDLARRDGVIAIGECGFDATGLDGAIQAAAFRAQCGVARSLGLPLILHIDGAGAWPAFVDQAAEVEGLTVVRHYFSGDAAQADWHRERGHFLSFGNPLRRSPELRDIARTYPEEFLLIETDSYPLPGRNTEPCHVPLIGETLALVRGWTFGQAREQLAGNTLRAFPKLRASDYFSL